jgi:purine-binding chemotaxis protein CheW
MADQAQLIFRLRQSFYAVEARVVRGIFWLPELAPIAEAPGYIVGVVNLRGEVVPVMDLDLRLGNTPPGYCPADSVVIVEWQGLLTGILVNEVHDVRSLFTEEMAAAPSYGQADEVRPRFVAGVAKVEENIIALLNLANLIQCPDGISARPSFLLEATPAEKAVLHERAQNLRCPTDGQDLAGLTPLAVVGLGGEYFGLEPEVVREFSDIREVTPVPCCPEHIVGSMNLRGDIITLIDVRGLLKMPRVSNRATGKVVVVHMDGLFAGVLVDEIFDVIYLRPTDKMVVPAAVQSVSEEYLRGTAPYNNKVLSILDLAKILASESLVVNEKV